MNLALLFIIISVMGYSLYPLFGTIPVIQNYPWLFTLIVMTSSVIGSFLSYMALGGLKKDRLLRLKKCLKHKPFVLWGVTSGVINGLSHAFLFKSFQLLAAPKALLIYESWAFWVIFMMPFIAPKRFYRASFREIILGFTAFLGLLTLSIGKDSKTSGIIDITFDHINGAFFAFMAAILMAMAASTMLKLQDAYDDAIGLSLKEIKNILLKSTFIGLFYKSFAALICLIAYLIFHIPNTSSLPLDDVIFWGIIAGLFIVTISSTSYDIAHLFTKRPSINILCYLTPCLSLSWLWYYQLAPITPLILIGATLIILPNIMVFILQSKKLGTKL